MTISVHIRNPRQWPALASMGRHLAGVYERVAANGSRPRTDAPAYFNDIKPTGLYVGDEFCMPRLPDPSALRHMGRMAQANDMKLTLLTPVLTEVGLAQCHKLWDILAQVADQPRVVVNDLGSLHYVRHHFPDFQIAAGRLMDKGLKDPRLEPMTDPHLQESVFDHGDMRQALQALSVTGLDRDLKPWAPSPAVCDQDLKTTVYFPFGYFTSGRVCLMARNGKGASERFLPPLTCRRPCNRGGIRLHHGDFNLQVVQNGNSLYYLYPWQQCCDLLTAAARSNIDLVYQGIFWRRHP